MTRSRVETVSKRLRTWNLIKCLGRQDDHYLLEWDIGKKEETHPYSESDGMGVAFPGTLPLW